MVSFCLPHLVVVSFFRMFIDLSALALVSLVCSLKYSFVSSVSPSISGFRMVGIKVLFMVRLLLHHHHHHHHHHHRRRINVHFFLNVGVFKPWGGRALGRTSPG